MSRVIRADVPEPLWDQVRGIVVMPERFSEAESAAAMLALVRDRCCSERLVDVES